VYGLCNFHDDNGLTLILRLVSQRPHSLTTHTDINKHSNNSFLLTRAITEVSLLAVASMCLGVMTSTSVASEDLPAPRLMWPTCLAHLLSIYLYTVCNVWGCIYGLCNSHDNSGHTLLLHPGHVPWHLAQLLISIRLFRCNTATRSSYAAVAD